MSFHLFSLPFNDLEWVYFKESSQVPTKEWTTLYFKEVWCTSLNNSLWNNEIDLFSIVYNQILNVLLLTFGVLFYVFM